MTKLIILSAGHSNVPGRDQGASANGYIEGHLAVEFRQLVANELRKIGIKPVMDGNNTILSESLNFFRKIVNSENAICLDIHWNSASPKATGTEMLVPAEYTKTEYSLALDLSMAVHKLLGIPLRNINGVRTELDSHHKKLGWMTLKGTNVLMELCFITNSSDMEAYQENKFRLAAAIARILFNYANGLSRNANIDYSSKKTTIHEVKQNETLWGIAQMYKSNIEVIKNQNSLSSDILYVGQKLEIPQKN